MGWEDHLNEAEYWLYLAHKRADVPAKVVDCLYQGIVEITQALMELEKKHE